MKHWNKNEDRLIYFFLFIVVFLGGFLRFYNLGNIILYWDEPLHCIRIAYQPLSFVLAYNNASAFFALLVHLLLPLGKTEVMARLPSALFGSLSIAAVYLLGKLLFSKKEGLAAAAFLAFSPFLIRYSQYSRAYSTFIFFTLLSFYFFLRALREDRIKFWLPFCLFTALGIYTHLFALLLLPAYAVFAVISWLREKKKIKIKKFFLWTLLLLILVSILYIPDVNTRNFLLDSFIRTKAQPSESSVSIFLINEILWNQLEQNSLFFYVLILSLAFLGLADGLKKHALKILFILFCILIPFFIFTAIRPREVNILSADRYFIFFLPLIFLLTARGTTFFSRVLASIPVRIKRLRWNKRLAAGIIFGLLLFVMIGGGFNYKHYYLNFWRLGSVSIKREVRNFLERNVKEDSLIYFDIFPASHQIMVVNPLTKDLTTQEIELVIREKVVTVQEKTKVMVYRISEGVFQWLAHKDVSLWSVTRLDSKNQKKLLLKVREYPEIKAFPLENHIVLHFKKNNTPLAQKLSRMADIFISLDISNARKKEFHLLAARANLFDDKFEEASRNIKKAKEIVLKPEETEIPDSPLVFQLFDTIFGLSGRELRRRSQDYFYETGMARHLYRQGNRFLVQKKYEEAARAYRECLSLKQEYAPKVSNRLALIGDRYSVLGNDEKAIASYREALELDPSRYDINFLLAEAFRKGGFLLEARKAYRQTFNLNSLSSEILDRLTHSPQLVIIWEKNSVWHLLFKSRLKTEFSGHVSGSNKIKNTRRFRISKDNSLEIFKKEIRFSLKTTKRKIKALDFKVPQKSSLTFDIKTNGERKINTILLPGKKQKPEKIPFTIK